MLRLFWKGAWCFLASWVSGCQENFYSSSPECLEKAGRMSSHFVDGPNEEWPIISQPQCGRCQWRGHSKGYWQQAELRVHWNDANWTVMMMMFDVVIYDSCLCYADQQSYSTSSRVNAEMGDRLRSIPSWCSTKPPRPTQPGHPSVGRRNEY